jgi:Dyp-type peroxidase family
MSLIARSRPREAPFPPRDSRTACAPEKDEPLLRVANIQGNILAGFNKDHQVLLFLEILDKEEFRGWLGELANFVASTEEVLGFNRLFKMIRSRRRSDTRTVQSTWMNIAFSFRGLSKLAPRSVEQFRDEAFREGVAARSARLGDPPKGEGSPASWVVGGKDNEADVVLIFAGDERGDVLSEVARIEDSIFAARFVDGRPLRCGVRVVFKQEGATLPPPLTGHEQFGFLDGVSQPGIRGRTSDEPHSVFTLRQNPNDPDQGKPGQDLLWPGEFVFDYPGQNPRDVEKSGENSLRPGGKPVAPEWARDGSYLVFRRLRQDVPGFRAFLADQAKKLGMTTDLFGAKVVGRYRSGAPIVRTGNCPVDHSQLGGDDCRNNAFEFGGHGTGKEGKFCPKETAEEAVVRLECDEGTKYEADYERRHGPSGAGDGGDGPHPCGDDVERDCGCPPEDEFPSDPDGPLCPFAGHIRKAYPRDDRGTASPDICEGTTQTHRIMRRGIPFGPPFPSDPPEGYKDPTDRGLLFLCYQTSIVEQFEFIQTAWANNPDFKDVAKGKVPRPGFDLIIGQNGGKDRDFVVPLPDGSHAKITAKVDWVIPTGAGYFFSPSIPALCGLADGSIR